MARIEKTYASPVNVGDVSKYNLGLDGKTYKTINVQDTDIRMLVERTNADEVSIALTLPKKVIELTDAADPAKGKQVQAIMACIGQHKIDAAVVTAPSEDELKIELSEDGSLATTATAVTDQLKADLEQAIEAHNSAIPAPVVNWNIPANDGDEVERWISADGTISDTASPDSVETILERVKDGEYQLQVVFPTAKKVALATHGKKLNEIIKGALKIKEVTPDDPDDDSIAFGITTDTNSVKKAEREFAEALAEAIKKHNAAVANNAGAKAEPTDLITLEAGKSPNGSTLPSIPGLQKRSVENYIRQQRAAGLAVLLPKEYKLADGTILKVADVS